MQQKTNAAKYKWSKMQKYQNTNSILGVPIENQCIKGGGLLYGDCILVSFHFFLFVFCSICILTICILFFCILSCLYFGILHFVLFVFCPICILLHLYFVTFVFWPFVFCSFVFCRVCILFFCILFYLYFVYVGCILFCLYYGTFVFWHGFLEVGLDDSKANPSKPVLGHAWSNRVGLQFTINELPCKILS